MVSCFVTKCCCGCLSLATGIGIIAVIDMIYNFIFITFFDRGWGHYPDPGSFLIILMIFEAILIFGLVMRSRLLVMIFVIGEMFNIFIGYSMWVIIPVISIFRWFEGFDYENHCNHAQDGLMPGTIMELNMTLAKEGNWTHLPKPPPNPHHHRDDCRDFMVRLFYGSTVTFVYLWIHLIVQPIYHTYFFIVVRSYFKISLENHDNAVHQVQLPTEQPGQPMVYVLNNQPNAIEYKPVPSTYALQDPYGAGV